MKKWIALLLSLAMTLALTACDGMEEVVFDLLDEALSASDASDGEASQGDVVTILPADDSNKENAAEENPQAEASTDSVEFTDSTDYTAESSGYTATGSEQQSVDYVGGDFTLDEEGTYTTYEDVALYIVTYEHLPENFMTKDEARELGWNGGGLDDYAYGMCIGGDRFGNKEGALPRAKGRVYHECDIDTLHANKRGAERIVYSNDGLVYYTDDHYETFTLLYGEE